MKLNLGQESEVNILIFKLSPVADVWSKFLSWCLVNILKMKFDQDLCQNLWYELNSQVCCWQCLTQELLIIVQLSAEGWQYPCKRARNGFSSPCPFSDSRKTQLPIVMLLPLQRQSAAICPMMEGRQFPLQDFSIARCGFLYHPEMGSGKSVTSYWGHSRVGGQGSSGEARLGEGAQQLPISRWSMYVASWNHGRPKLSSPDASMQAFGIEREKRWSP